MKESNSNGKIILEEGKANITYDYSLKPDNIEAWYHSQTSRHPADGGLISQMIKPELMGGSEFIDEYTEILVEKVKALERLILKSYIEMTLKAVANEYLTVGFLNNELKIKKQNIQDHLLFLISSGELKGKYDPRFAIYYENPEILDDLDKLPKPNIIAKEIIEDLEAVLGQVREIENDLGNTK